MIHTPGHSPGSVFIVVDTDEGKCVLTEDVPLFAGQALTRTHPAVFWNEQQAIKSIDRVLDEADIIYPGHDQPFRVVKGKIEYVEQMRLTITGVSKEGPGLVCSAGQHRPSTSCRGSRNRRLRVWDRD